MKKETRKIELEKGELELILEALEDNVARCNDNVLGIQGLRRTMSIKEIKYFRSFWQKKVKKLKRLTEINRWVLQND